ncbi:MAG: tetratricopeptide repeat protein [Candidatus Acidiferrales bacterium]
MKRHWVQFVAAASATVALSLLLISCAGNPQKARLKYLQKGEAYMKQSQYSSAAIEFRNALKVDPRYTEAYFQLAKADLALRDGNGAFAALGQAITLDPSRSDIRIARAEMLSGGHYYNPATDDIKYVLKQDPNNAEAHRIFGSILVAQKQYDQALQEFSKAAALAPNQAESYLDIALANMALRHPSDTELNIKKAIQVDPQSVPAYLDLANFYRLQNNPDQAEQALQEGIKIVPSAIPLYLNLARAFESQGKASDAENVLNSLSAQLPKSTDAALGIGDFYLETRMNDRALAAYQRGLSNDPKNITLQERIEDLYITTKQTDLAAKLDGELLKQSPNDVLARINHGRVLMAQGKVSDAIDALQKVAADAANSPQAHYYLAMAYWQSNNLAQANDQLQQTLRVSPTLPIALTALANLNFGQGKYSVAQLYAHELVQENPADPRAHLMLAQSLLKLGQIKQAGDEFAAAQKLAPNDPTIHANLASLYAAENKFPEAENELKSAMAEAPGSVSVVTDYINFLISQKQLPKANALATQFLAQNPNEAGAHLLMGQIDMLDKNSSAALSETQKALQLSPKSAGAYIQMGQIYRDQGNNNAAVQAYEQGMTLTQPSAPLIAVIGNIYMAEGDLTKASSEFQKALSIDPNFVIAANNLAWIYAEQGQNLDVALGLAQKAKAEQPEVPSFSDTLAWVMFRKGDYAGALPLLQYCVKKVPDSAQFHFHLGMVLVADGQKTEGKAQLQAALHMNLDNQDAEQARKALSQ